MENSSSRHRHVLKKVVERIPANIERKRWQVENRNFKIVDLVDISDINIHFSDWPSARIIEDNEVQVVNIKTTNREYLQPAVNLCLLEHLLLYKNNK